MVWPEYWSYKSKSKNIDNNNHLLILKMGRTLKFISLRLILFLFGGVCAAPKLRRVSPQDLWLNDHPIGKIMILRKQMIFSAEYGSKVVKFSKNDRLDMLILLARDEQFLFPHWKRSKGGPLEDFSYFHQTLNLCFWDQQRQ